MNNTSKQDSPSVKWWNELPQFTKDELNTKYFHTPLYEIYQLEHQHLNKDKGEDNTRDEMPRHNYSDDVEDMNVEKSYAYFNDKGEDTGDLLSVELLAIDALKKGWGQLFMRAENGSPYGKFIAQRPYPKNFWHDVDNWINGYNVAAVSNKQLQEENKAIKNCLSDLYYKVQDSCLPIALTQEINRLLNNH